MRDKTPKKPIRSIKSGVYSITNICNKKMYVGSSKNIKARKYEHLYELRKNKHHNKYLQRAYNKYGEKSFIWNILEYVELNENIELSKNSLLEREQYWIDFLETVSNGYNLLPNAGSRLGSPHSQETKNKMLGNTNAKGIKKIFTEEHKYNISCSKIGKTSPRKGINLSEEQKEKISKSMMGKNKGIKRKPLSEEQKMSISKTRIRRRIINKTTGVIFNSISDAEKLYNISHGNICNVCKGRCSEAGGYEWGYYE